MKSMLQLGQAQWVRYALLWTARVGVSQLRELRCRDKRFSLARCGTSSPWSHWPCYSGTSFAIVDTWWSNTVCLLTGIGEKDTRTTQSLQRCYPKVLKPSPYHLRFHILPVHHTRTQAFDTEMPQSLQDLNCSILAPFLLVSMDSQCFLFSQQVPSETESLSSTHQSVLADDCSNTYEWFFKVLTLAQLGFRV